MPHYSSVASFPAHSASSKDFYGLKNIELHAEKNGHADQSFGATHDNSEECTAYFNIMFHFLFKYSFRRQNPTQGVFDLGFQGQFPQITCI